MSGKQRLQSLAPAVSTHGRCHEADIGQALVVSAQRPLEYVQRTLRASQPADVTRTTAVSAGGLVLPTLNGQWLNRSGSHKPDIASCRQEPVSPACQL